MKANKRGCFVAFRNDRLGGRLNAVLTAMRLAKAHDTTFKIFWSLSDESSPELHAPEELFSKRFIKRHFISREEGRTLLAEATDIGALNRSMTIEAFDRTLAHGTNYLSNAATEQILLPWETEADLKILPSLMQEVEFHPVVRKALVQIDAALAGMNFSSYHLRRGDIIDDSTFASHNLWSNKYIPRVIYEWHMKRELAGDRGRLVIFSDELREAAAFSALSPRVSGFNDLLGDMVLTPLQRDFLELYTMSRSDTIFAPPSSAFSGLAAAIGNKKVTDIEADLSPEDRAAAMDELVRRLEDRPDAFLSQSDAGQNLPFMAEHLEARSEGRRAVSIAMNLVENGMDRAYVYPFMSERMLAQKDYNGCDRLLDMMTGRLCQREEHWSNVYLHAALADMARENWERAIQRFQSGAWFYPINKLASQIFWYLASTHRLTAENGLPYDLHLMRPAARIFDEEETPTHRQLMERLRAAKATPVVYPANMEVRDWRLLSGKKLSFRFSNKAKIRQQAEILGANLTKRNNSTERTAALHSAVGAMLTDAGSLGPAERSLSDALNVMPDTPLYLKRQADFLMSAGRFQEAIATMERAWVLSDRQPCFQAVLALSYQQVKDTERYEELMMDMASADTQLVELRFLIVEAMRRSNKHLPSILPHLDQLAAMAPGSHRILSLQAKVYEQLGLWEQAMSSLKAMEAMVRPQAVMHNKLTGLFKAYRRENTEAGARAWFMQNGIAAPEGDEVRGTA